MKSTPNDLYLAGEYAAAVEALEEHAATAGLDADGHELLGMARMQLGMHDQAVEAFESARQLGASGPHLDASEAVCSLRGGKAERAGELLKVALEQVSGATEFSTLRLIAEGIYLVGEPEDARRIAALLPPDPSQPASTWLSAACGYRFAEVQEEPLRGALLDEVDKALKGIVNDPNGNPFAESAERLLTRMAERRLRRPGNFNMTLRLDVFEYMVTAIKLFKKMPPDTRNLLVHYLCTAGQNGLDINNPEARLFVPALGRSISHLNAVSIMYVGLKLVAPQTDLGIDLSLEYDTASAFTAG